MFKKAIIKLFLLFLFIQLTGVSCNNKSSNPEINRPTENWVFRSVLDKKSRIATVALNKNMWLAYNTQTATLYKAWKGGVDFDGAVYTTRHGPQPTSLGYAYYAHNEAWVLFDNEKEIKPKVQYKGHRFENGEVIFKFLLETPDNKKI